MLQFNTEAGAELFKIKLIPVDARLFADCFCLIQLKRIFFAHNIKLTSECRRTRNQVATSTSE
jgi:hypothetical protein